MADFDAQLPVRALASEFTTEVANSTGTTINPAEDYAQGSTTSGQNGVLIQGAVTTSQPTYSTGQTSPLSLDTSGNLRVTIDSSSSLQNVNVTQWDSVALGSPSAYGTSPGAVQVIGVNAFITNTPTVTANQGTANATPWNQNIAQWGGTSTSLGQKASSASVPVVIASDQSSISVTPVIPSAVVTYFTDAAVASGATVTHSIAGPINVDEVHMSGSGELKANIAYGTTGSETDHYILFTSASSQNANWGIKNTLVIPTGQSLKVTIKNRDTSAQDTYLSVTTH